MKKKCLIRMNGSKKHRAREEKGKGVREKSLVRGVWL